MSGEAGGVLVGGVVALAVAPVVIAGAATLGLAYGALKVGGFLGKQALDYAAEKKREKELVVGQCSVQLDSLYSQMRSVVRDETNQHAKIVDEMSEQFKQIGLELKDLYDRKPSADELDKNINISRKEVSAKLGSESSIIRDKLISKGRKSLSKCIETIEKSNAEKAELIQWADKTVASVEMQKTAAVEMLRDAEASYRVIESMAKSSNDTNFVNQVRTIFLTLQRSRSMMDQAMYQGAFSNARTVVRECAITASEHVQDELESDMLIMELRAKIYYLSTLRHLGIKNNVTEELPITTFLDNVQHKVLYRHWYLGHFHVDVELWKNQTAIFNSVRELVSGRNIRQ